MTLEELYRQGTDMLRSAGVENPSVDAFYLLEYAAGLTKTKYLMYKEQPVSNNNIRQYTDLINERMKRIPYQYITGRADFAGLIFEVNRSVLIPRLDTEVLFENALRRLCKDAYVLDLCTGSGALGIALKRYRPDIHMVLSDISEDALNTAALNVRHNHLDVAEKKSMYRDPRTGSSGQGCGYDLDYGIRLIKSDLFDNMTVSDDGSGKEVTGLFDVLVSNPPYVSESEYPGLMPEVKDHEPKLALVAGEDGLDMYRRIAKDAGKFLKKGASMLLEIGCTQAGSVRTLLQANGFTDIEVIKDLAGLDRVMVCKNSN